jgi:hypothetical protein
MAGGGVGVKTVGEGEGGCSKTGQDQREHGAIYAQRSKPDPSPPPIRRAK